jgi:Na+-driven multidrug efflux pump
MAGLGGPLYLILMIMATPLLRLWLRNQTQSSLSTALRIMLIGSFLSLLCVPGYYILLGLGQARCCFTSAAIQGAGSLAIIGLLILTTGSVSLNGVLSGVAAGMALCTVYILWTLRKVIREFKVSSLHEPEYVAVLR